MSTEKQSVGIDISHHQPPDDFDWDVVEKQVDFVYARATYGVRSDAAFPDHVAECQERDIDVGAYHFFRQQQDPDAQFEAFVGELDRVEMGEGDLLPTIDLEWNDKYDGSVNKEWHNTRGRKLIERVAERYGSCMVYLAPGFYQTLGEPAWLLEYPWWVAHYTSKPEPWVPWADKLPNGTWSIWQHTGKGRIKGYPRDIDMNRAKHLHYIDATPEGIDDDQPPTNVDAGDDDEPEAPGDLDRALCLVEELREELRRLKG